MEHRKRNKQILIRTAEDVYKRLQKDGRIRKDDPWGEVAEVINYPCPDCGQEITFENDAVNVFCVY